jgi:hypothetical protein
LVNPPSLPIQLAPNANVALTVAFSPFVADYSTALYASSSLIRGLSLPGGSAQVSADGSTAANPPPPPPPNGDFSLTTYLGANAANILWVAARAGNDSWQQLSGTGGVYSFRVPPSQSGRYSIAAVCPPGSSPTLPSVEMQILELTTPETTAPQVLCKDVSTRWWSLSGTFTNIPASHCVQWNLWTYGPPWGGCNPTYFASAPAGTYDFVVATTPGRAAPPADRLLIVPNVLLDSDRVVNPDLSGSIALSSNTGSILAWPSYTIESAAVYFHTAGGSLALLGSGGRSASSINFGGVPLANLGSGIHEFQATVSNQAQRETLSLFFSAPGNRSADLSIPIPFAPTVTIAGTIAYPRPQADFDAVSGAALYGMRYHQGDFVTGSRQWDANALVSAGWFAAVGGRPSYALPDLGSAPGFDPRWWIQSGGAAIAWTAAVHELGSGTFDNLLQVLDARTQSVPNGFVHRTSSASGSVR